MLPFLWSLCYFKTRPPSCALGTSFYTMSEGRDLMTYVSDNYTSYSAPSPLNVAVQQSGNSSDEEESDSEGETDNELETKLITESGFFSSCRKYYIIINTHYHCTPLLLIFSFINIPQTWLFNEIILTYT